MPVVPVGVVRVPVHDGRVLVPVRVGLARRIVRRMRVPVMLVVAVAVLVLRRLVFMFVLVPFGDVEPQPDRHQRAGRQQVQAQRLVQHDDGKHRADERCE